MKERKRKRK